MAMADPSAAMPVQRSMAPVPLPSRRPSDIDAAQVPDQNQNQDAAQAQLASADAGPRMIWQAGPNGAAGQMASNIPLPPIRPDSERPGSQDGSQPAPQQVASLDDQVVPPAAAARPVVDPKPPIFADLSQGSEGFMKRSSNRQAQRARDALESLGPGARHAVLDPGHRHSGTGPVAGLPPELFLAELGRPGFTKLPDHLTQRLPRVLHSVGI
jgi:hypothetical protein